MLTGSRCEDAPERPGRILRRYPLLQRHSPGAGFEGFFGPVTLDEVLKDLKIPALMLKDIVAAFKTGKSETKDC